MTIRITFKLWRKYKEEYFGRLDTNKKFSESYNNSMNNQYSDRKLTQKNSRSPTKNKKMKVRKSQEWRFNIA